MDELDKGLDISLTGPRREEILARFRERIDAWGEAVPPAEPLVLDFGLDRFDEVGLIECWIANEADAGYCGKYLFVFDGQTCPRHRHADKHETFFIVRGTVEMEYDDRVFEMNPGDVLPVEQGTYHRFTGKGPALLLEISKPCVIDDNFFHDTAIPIGGNHRPSSGED